MLLMESKLKKIITKSILHIEKVDYKSYDLFDALTCTWIDKATRKSDLARRIAIQINATSPINLHWLGMKKMIHTKLISDLLWTCSLNSFHKEALILHKKLLDLRCNDTLLSWGLNFPYTSRFINADSRTPNIYNTATSGLAICELHKLDIYFNDEIIKQIEEIVDSLFQIFSFKDESSIGWFSYYPGQKSPTYNVNALTAYFLCKSNNAIDKKYAPESVIQKLINLLIVEQNSDGSWYYSRSAQGKWIDGFHSGFIIESLAYLYSHGFESRELFIALEKAFRYYTNNLFTNDGFPKYYSNSKKYPIEAQNCAQAIQTLSLAGIWLGWDQKELLERLIDRTLHNLYNPEGFFYYKTTRYFTYKQSYLRWSTAPMLVALSYAEEYFKHHTKSHV